MLPFSYAVRNLLRSPSRLLQMVGGSAVVVLLVCFAAAFSSGMDASLAASGDERNVIVLGVGSEESVERSEVPAVAAGILAAHIPGLAQSHGHIAASAEVYYNGLVEVTADQPKQAIIRGVTPTALAVHRHLRLLEGTFPGPDEMMVGVQTHKLIDVPEDSLAIGQSIYFEGREYRISGRFIAPGTVLESEIWMDLNDIMAVTQRETLSSVVLRLDTAEFADVDLFCSMRLDLELVAIPETVYYGKLAVFFTPIKLMTWLTALLIAAGAIFGGLNTFYAAFSSRIGEFGTLQAIGFRRRVIVVSLIQEGMMTTIGGTLAALTIGLLIIDGRHMHLSSGLFNVEFTNAIMVLGFITGGLLGLLGTLPPALRCLLTDLPRSLRST